MNHSLPAEKKMSNCPHCAKPVMNNGQFIGAAQFRIRCPWCQKNIMIKVETKISAAPMLASQSMEFEDLVQRANEPARDQQEERLHSPPLKESQVTPFDIPVGRGMKLLGYLYSDQGSGPPNI